MREPPFELVWYRMNAELTDPASSPTNASRVASLPPTVAIRELSKLIADIRTRRMQFQNTVEEQAPVPLEMVVGGDPRD